MMKTKGINEGRKAVKQEGRMGGSAGGREEGRKEVGHQWQDAV
jgi:hypothetical protein